MGGSRDDIDEVSEGEADGDGSDLDGDAGDGDGCELDESMLLDRTKINYM